MVPYPAPVCRAICRKLRPSSRKFLINSGSMGRRGLPARRFIICTVTAVQVLKGATSTNTLKPRIEPNKTPRQVISSTGKPACWSTGNRQLQVPGFERELATLSISHRKAAASLIVSSRPGSPSVPAEPCRIASRRRRRQVGFVQPQPRGRRDLGDHSDSRATGQFPRHFAVPLAIP